MSSEPKEAGLASSVDVALDAYVAVWLAGEAPDPERFCRDHPECGEELRSRIEDLLFVDRKFSEVRKCVVRERELTGSSGALAGTSSASGGEARLGPYKLEREIGRGAQGIVYLAEDTRLHRKVAVKVMGAWGPGSERLLARFWREGEVASRLDHPGICTIYDSGVEGGIPYIAMRYVEGPSLAQSISGAKAESAIEDESSIEDGRKRRDGPSSSSGPNTRREIRAVIRVIEKAARALHTAHGAGVVHRDIKPGNIMVTPEGEPVITDFGLARAESVDLPTLTLSGEVFGTPAYMCPEQVTGPAIPADARADVWSLGATLYECLTLRRPFEAPTLEGLCRAIQSEEPPDPRRFNAAISHDLRVILETALEKDRQRRYHTALELAEDLRRVREYEPIAARPTSSWIKLQRWAQRNRALAGSVTAGLLALCGGLVVALFLLTQRDAALRAKSLALVEKESALQRYDQMSDVALVEELKAQAAKLWPRRPHMLQAMSEWLEKAHETHRRLSLHEAALRELRDRAAPYDAAQKEADDEERREVYAELFDAVAVKALQISEAEESGEQSVVLREELISLKRDPRLEERLTWQLSNSTDHWRHQVLSQLVKELGDLGALIADVEERESFAKIIEKRSVEDHRSAWDRCLADLRTNPKYTASAAPEAMDAQIGLVPLGIDRDSGLWEFWHVDSGERPRWEGSDWAANASVDPRGKAEILESSGIVLVLVLGGGSWMGAQRDDPADHNYDPDAQALESPVHEVSLDAYFISKYELTQAQWERLTGNNDSSERTGKPKRFGGFITGLHPVESVSWYDCCDAMLRWDLELPTEAQWEYACRAGTSTVYWCGDPVASIQERRAGNIAEAGRLDGYYVHAPVGLFAANAFGLHDVLGNVGEWCRDRRRRHYLHPDRPGEGLRDEPGARYRAVRGGSYNLGASMARSAAGFMLAPDDRGINVGLRPSRGSH